MNPLALLPAGLPRLALKLAPFVAIALLLAALLQTRGTLARVKLEAKAAQLVTERDSATRLATAEAHGRQAAESYVARTAALAPLIVRSTNTVREYAQTPAGRVPCLDAERVRGLDEFDLSLFTPTASGSGAGAVRADAGASPAGRIGERR